jgi:hypothetical protein
MVLDEIHNRRREGAGPNADDCQSTESQSTSGSTSPSCVDAEDISFPSYENNERNVRDEQNQIPRLIERPEDDTAVCVEPVSHVDYLSHRWNEEDIWSTWKHVVSKHKVYSNSARLQNASWRVWEKVRRNLETVSPEAVRW